jgi:uncharacterized protein YodC (DUF2158 family)
MSQVATNAELKAGDTVRLKSGGPLMTVTMIVDQEIQCMWFDKKDERKQDFFHVATLDKDDGTMGYG